MPATGPPQRGRCLADAAAYTDSQLPRYLVVPAKPNTGRKYSVPCIQTGLWRPRLSSRKHHSKPGQPVRTAPETTRNTTTPCWSWEAISFPSPCRRFALRTVTTLSHHHHTTTHATPLINSPIRRPRQPKRSRQCKQRGVRLPSLSASLARLSISAGPSQSTPTLHHPPPLPLLPPSMQAPDLDRPKSTAVDDAADPVPSAAPSPQ